MSWWFQGIALIFQGFLTIVLRGFIPRFYKDFLAIFEGFREILTSFEWRCSCYCATTILLPSHHICIVLNASQKSAVKRARMSVRMTKEGATRRSSSPFGVPEGYKLINIYAICSIDVMWWCCNYKICVFERIIYIHTLVLTKEKTSFPVGDAYSGGVYRKS